MSDTQSAVLYESDDLVATITINRPEKRNAISEAVSVQRAYETGLVNKIVPKGKHKAVAREWARKIADNAPLVVQTLKHFALETMPRSPAERICREVGRMDVMKASEDRKEAQAARSEKRTPVFKGR